MLKSTKKVKKRFTFTDSAVRKNYTEKEGWFKAI
jgi:prophage antirepressor-like protein